MDKWRARTGFGLVLLGMGMAAPARAEGPAPSAAQAAQEQGASERADALVKQGNALANKDRWAEAEPLFQEAFRLKQSYDIAGNLGLAESALGRWRQAAAHLRFALDGFPANGKPEHRKLLELSFQRARAEVGALAVDVDTAGAAVLVDGEPAGFAPLGREVFVEPGAHTVEARLAGREGATLRVEVPKGGSATAELRLPARRAEPIPPGRQAPRPAAAVRELPLVPVLVGGGLALIGLGTGVGLTVAANAKSSDARSLRAQVSTSWACHAPAAEMEARCSSLHDALRAKDSLTNGAVGAFIVGGVLLAGTAGFVVWDRLRDGRSTAVGVVPSVGPRAGGVTVVGTW
ncbi:hypothetical protein ACMHYB_57860 [Sorangium sp. So ce1128]